MDTFFYHQFLHSSLCSSLVGRMSSDGEHDFESQVTSSGASLTYPVQCSALRKNGFVMIKGNPCKIVEMSTSKTGKHGSAKVNLVGIDIFTNKKYEDISPSTHNMDVPNVNRKEYTVIGVDGGFLSLMDTDGNTKDDVKIPEGELGEKIIGDFNDEKELIVSVLSAVGQEACVAVKEAPKGS